MEQIKSTTEAMAIMAGVSVDVFIKNRKRYEEYLIKDGWVFSKEGRGDKTVYYIQQKIEKDWQDMTIAERIEDVFGFKPKYPKVMLGYIMWLNDNQEAYLNDREMALMLGYKESTKKKINACRNELISNVYMIPLDEQSKAKFFLVDKDEKVVISRVEWAKCWQQYFLDMSVKKRKMQANGLIIEDEQAFRQQAFMEMVKNNGGVLNKTKAREINNNFKIKINEYIKKENGGC